MRILQTLVAVLVVSTLASMIDLATWGGRQITVANVVPELGHAYFGTLSDRGLSELKGPTGALLFLVETRKGGMVRSFEPLMGDSFLYQWAATLFDNKFPNETHETRKELGPGNSVHADIRTAGSGRYSVWEGNLFFSLPDNTRLTSKQRVELIIPLFPAINDAHFRQVTLSLLRTLAFLSAISLIIIWVARTCVPKRHLDAIFQNTAPGLAITSLLLIFGFAGAEIYFRASGMFPVSQAKLPGFFEPGIGIKLTPGGTIKWTNGLDFWNEENANSLGLADNEPELPKPAGTYRILIAGASYVEALQVPTRVRFQSLLSPMLKKAYPNRALDVVTIGMSGTSQSNQLPLFERLKQRLQPDLVLLLFSENDFANNSSLLAALRHGWDPRFLPLVFFERNGEAGCSQLPISPDYGKHMLSDTVAERLEQTRMISPAYRDALGKWDYYHPEMDRAFAEKELPAPVFNDALELTKCVLGKWKQYALSDGFKLAVVATPHMTTNGEIERLRGMLAQLDLPLFDLRPKFSSEDLTRSTFKHDAHWNALGHRLVAEGIFEYVRASGYLE